MANAILFGAGDVAVRLIEGDEVERALYGHHVRVAVKLHNDDQAKG